ncbi:GbsR/MarR family transcriptional regulator [Vitiosangium sp. GDMCC 1.1324]|uniref:GbsR/MarR family transcriptional regulator n=1 Tax=Vitiosangium sp. (strain GDMCC 1.1324) TaxID=2138576 RepID=UPI000D350EB6|nr:MarR family transcriptional regulator [Vitiosangium sp. GDMCC 1.1324]PTL80521.1 transcriptional regulator [Vitiosangium sp. GDMCC 1.1324]
MRQDSVSADEERFIESMGLFFERQGVPRIGGRLLGLLLVADKPLAPGEIAELLKVSPASVSTNIRQLQASGLVDPASIPGDRRHYYVFNSVGWDHRLELAISAMDAMAQLCQDALASPKLKGRHKLREAVEFCDFYRQELMGAAERWRARFARRPGTQASNPSPSARPRRNATR